MTTEGSAEVPAGDVVWVTRGEARWLDQRKDVEDERTRLEARLAEVEAERDLTQRNFDRVADVVSCGGALDEMEARALKAVADLTALRAAVRPLVEAAQGFLDSPALPVWDEGYDDWMIARKSARAALADPAIAALLDQQKEQG